MYDSNSNYEMERTLIICGLLSIIIIILIVIFIIIYCICKKRRKKNKLNSSNIYIEDQSIKSNNINQNNNLFQSLPNNSSLGNSTKNITLPLSEIREENLTEQIHTIINSTSSSGSDSDRKKKRKKVVEKVIEVKKVIKIIKVIEVI